MSLLEGPVVFIDDDYAKADQPASRMFKKLWDSGRVVRPYDAIPPMEHIGKWEGLSLVVLDWNLLASDLRVSGTATLQASQQADLIAFVDALLARYFCPIFIVSASDKNKIEQELRDDASFPDAALGSRVRVIHKDDVADDDLVKKLGEEIKSDPALSVLQTWEQQYHRAKDRMFIELGEVARDWPSYVVKSAEDDRVDPGYELLETLNANLRHRMDPVAFDLTVIRPAAGSDGDAIRRVRFGRTVLLAGSLNPSEVMTGDFFSSWRKSDPTDSIWLNLTPACYTVRGRRKAGDPDVRLHLVRGVPEDVPNNPDKFASWERERQRATRSELVHVLHDGRAYKFDFTTLQTFSWATVAKHRLGRLLPPFVTQVQQRHASFLTSEGLPRALPEMYTPQAPPAAGTTAAIKS